MPGTHSFEYSVIPHAGGWENALHQAHWFAQPLRARWAGRHAGPMGPESCFLMVSPASLIVSAVKLSEDGLGDVVVRIFNALGKPAEALLRGFFPVESARFANLAEEPGDGLSLEEPHTLRFPVAAHQIVTLRLTPT